MIIMQTPDAAARGEYILSRGLSNVIYSFSRSGVDCVQYHPKGIPGLSSRVVASNACALNQGRGYDARTRFSSAVA